jgi:hypothetical protein
LPVWVERFAGAIALLISLGLAAGATRAQSEENTPRPISAPVTGIITDRLTNRDLRRWNAIERIVFAEDAEGQPLHPALRGLWERLERSGHIIYIEMRGAGRAISNIAGGFHIEHLDPEGARHVAVIRLYPETIDRAYVGPNGARHEGFIPFLGLKKKERYAEVLGHEMAHALHILSDLTRARMVVELVQQTNESFLLYGRRNGYANIEPEMRQRLDRRDAFLKELEEPAEAAEMLIWREIASSRGARKKNRGREVFASRQ